MLKKIILAFTLLASVSYGEIVSHSNVVQSIYGGTNTRMAVYQGARLVYNPQHKTYAKSSPAVAEGGLIWDFTLNGQNYRDSIFLASDQLVVTEGGEINVFARGGGGGGGSCGLYGGGAGGGGAGGHKFATLYIPAGVYPVTVGSGGIGSPVFTQGSGSNGEDSVFYGVRALGGGGGGNGAGAHGGIGYAGLNGGCGGGGGYEDTNPGAGGMGLQGWNGHAGYTGSPYRGGGGGGSGNNGDGTGGIGMLFYVPGFDTYIGGGGGCGSQNSPTRPLGGLGGGGNGGRNAADEQNGLAGQPYTGSGGGGASFSLTLSQGGIGGSGGSGLVVVRRKIKNLEYDYLDRSNFNYRTNSGDITISAYIGTGDGLKKVPPMINGYFVGVLDTYAFYTETLRLIDVEVPNTVTSINHHCFYIARLTSLKTGNGITALNQGTIDGGVNVTNIVIGTNVVTINDYAFNNIPALPSVIIPASVTTIKNNAFNISTVLNHIYFEGNAPTLVGSDQFNGSTGVIYRLEGATGWPEVPNTFAGLTTAIWTNYPNPMP